MRIKYKAEFAIGVFAIVAGIALIITCIYLHRTSKIAFAFFPVLCGIDCLLNSIQTEKEREARRKELEAMFRKDDTDDKP